MERLVKGGQGRSDEEQYDVACMLLRLGAAAFVVAFWSLVARALFG